MDYEIQPIAPVAPKKSSAITSAMRQLSVGRSFVIPLSDIKPNTAKGLYSIARQLNIKISVRTVEDGLRVWRVHRETGAELNDVAISQSANTEQVARTFTPKETLYFAEQVVDEPEETSYVPDENLGIC